MALERAQSYPCGGISGTERGGGSARGHGSRKACAVGNGMVTQRGSHSGCVGRLESPTTAEAENPAEGGETRPQPRQDNMATAARGHSHTPQRPGCSFYQQFQNNSCTPPPQPSSVTNPRAGRQAAFPAAPAAAMGCSPASSRESPWPLEAASPGTPAGAHPAPGPPGRGCSALAVRTRRAGSPLHTAPAAPRPTRGASAVPATAIPASTGVFLPHTEPAVKSPAHVSLRSKAGREEEGNSRSSETFTVKTRGWGGNGRDRWGAATEPARRRGPAPLPCRQRGTASGTGSPWPSAPNLPAGPVRGLLALQSHGMVGAGRDLGGSPSPTSATSRCQQLPWPLQHQPLRKAPLPPGARTSAAGGLRGSSPPRPRAGLRERPRQTPQGGPALAPRGHTRR